MKLVFPVLLAAVFIAAWPGFALRFFAAFLLIGFIVVLFSVLHLSGQMGLEQARAKQPRESLDLQAAVGAALACTCGSRSVRPSEHAYECEYASVGRVEA